jgi:hypothetical protein
VHPLSCLFSSGDPCPSAHLGVCLLCSAAGHAACIRGCFQLSPWLRSGWPKWRLPACMFHRPECQSVV